MSSCTIYAVYTRSLMAQQQQQAGDVCLSQKRQHVYSTEVCSHVRGGLLFVQRVPKLTHTHTHQHWKCSGKSLHSKCTTVYTTQTYFHI